MNQLDINIKSLLTQPWKGKTVSGASPAEALAKAGVVSGEQGFITWFLQICFQPGGCFLADDSDFLEKLSVDIPYREDCTVWLFASRSR